MCFLENNMRRVVVTGLGLVTPLGGDVETTWANLIAAKSGAGRITRGPCADATAVHTKSASSAIQCLPRVPMQKGSVVLAAPHKPDGRELRRSGWCGQRATYSVATQGITRLGRAGRALQNWQVGPRRCSASAARSPKTPVRCESRCGPCRGAPRFAHVIKPCGRDVVCPGFASALGGSTGNLSGCRFLQLSRRPPARCFRESRTAEHPFRGLSQLVCKLSRLEHARMLTPAQHPGRHLRKVTDLEAEPYCAVSQVHQCL